MKKNSRIRQEISKRSSVETEEERAENRALWNTSRNGSRRREMGINRNRMRAILKIRRKKRERRTRNTEVRRVWRGGSDDQWYRKQKKDQEDQEQRPFAGQWRGVDHCRCEK